MRAWTLFLTALFAMGCGEAEDGKPASPTGEPTTETSCTPQPWYADGDGDGYGDDLDRVTACEPPDGYIAVGGDCDDDEATANPDGVEDCATGSIDEDCDGELGNNDAAGALNALMGWPDSDGDGFGDAAAKPVEYCLIPSGWTDDGSDCDDTRSDVYPGAIEVACDALDNDCDASTPDANDGDGDGYDECVDCDDGDDSVSPGAAETFCDGVDNDCNPSTADDVDADGDGASLCTTDCDDADPNVNPSAPEVFCDGIDNDCDPTTADDIDGDFDGAFACSGDCNDADPTIGPGVAEVACDGIDNDCDPATIDGVDADGDGLAECAGDCDDSEPLVYPGNTEVTCDGLDNDCDPSTVDDSDADFDGVSACAGDCDDTEPAVFPGAIELVCDGLDNDCDALSPDDEDLDLDGVGTCDGDCDDADPNIYPGAPDVVGDGLDTDCDGVDGPSLFEDFELGSPNPAVWSSVSGPVQVQTAVVDDGVYSARLGEQSYLETRSIDTSTCSSVLVVFDGLRGPNPPTTLDSIHIDYINDTGGWSHITYWYGNGLTDPDFGIQWWLVDAANAMHPNFRINLDQASAGAYEFHIDDLFVVCDPEDGDGDGTPDLADCAPTDPTHWADCGSCIDLDGDAYGVSCDLGDDCDDTDATVSYEGVDLLADGIDQDCNGVDGPPLIFDDFELGTPDPLAWLSVAGDAGVDPFYYWGGAFSLNMGGAGGVTTSVVVDTTGCANGIAWAYFGKRGPEQPDASDYLEQSWLGGGNAVVFDTWFGGSTDPVFLQRSGVILDPLARVPDFQLELISAGSGATYDDYYIDQISVGCAM